MWFHFSGEENIVDLPSRGWLAEELLSRAKLSIEELGWLKEYIASWFITKDIKKYWHEEYVNTFISFNEFMSLALTNSVVVPDMSQSTIENIIDISCYRALERLLKATAICLIFIDNCTDK